MPLKFFYFKNFYPEIPDSIVTAYKKVTRDSFLEDLEELYKKGGVSSRAYRFLRRYSKYFKLTCYCQLNKHFKKNKKFYKHHRKFCRAFIKFKQKILLHRLQSFYKKSLVSKDAYQILKQDINSFFKNLQDK